MKHTRRTEGLSPVKKKGRKFLVALPLSAAACAMGLVLAFAVRGAQDRPPGKEAPKGPAAAHEHRHTEKNDVFAIRCEHGIGAYQCDECRYEVGVVKLDPSVLTPPAQGRTPLIALTTVKRHRLRRVVTFPGTIRFNENALAHITPRLEGVIHSVNADVGDRVSAGQTLLSIESTQLSLAVASYLKSAALLTLAEQDLAREEKLFASKIGTQKQVLAARMEYEKHAAEKAAAAATLRLLGLSSTQIEELGTNLHSGGMVLLHVRSPFAGTVVQKHAVVGELAKPGDTVMEVADLSTLWISGAIYSNDLADLLKAQSQGPVPVTFTVDEFPGKTFTATLDYIASTADEKTRTVAVRAVAPNKEGLLRPGMFCRLSMELGPHKEVVAVPEEAVLADEGKRFAFTRLKEHYFIRRPVQVGRKAGGMVEILSGLVPGDVIVVRGAFLLKSDILREKMGAGCAD